MRHLEGYEHRLGRHCGSAALRNLSGFYRWGFDEPACFGFGAGLVSTYVDHSEQPWRVFHPSAPWLERAFLDRFEIPYAVREGDDWDDAWTNLTSHLDENDPVMLFVDPKDLEYLPDHPHYPPHVVLAVGYDEVSVLLSDATMSAPQAISTERLRDAWNVDRYVSMQHQNLVVTRPRIVEDRRTAATRAVRDTATYMLDPLGLGRTTRGPQVEGVRALETFAADVPTWADLPDPTGPLRDAVRALTFHGEDAALRGLYADAIEDLESWAHVGGDKGEQLHDIAREWRTVGELLMDALASGESEDVTATLDEAGSILGDIAAREESYFERIRERL
ncbi:MAG: BtrH N-terminal domain-containing protein [Halobacteriota archaeon]